MSREPYDPVQHQIRVLEDIGVNLDAIVGRFDALIEEVKRLNPQPLDAERLAAAINDAQIMGSEWWGRDLVPVAEKVAAAYEGKRR